MGRLAAALGHDLVELDGEIGTGQEVYRDAGRHAGGARLSGFGPLLLSSGAGRVRRVRQQDVQAGAAVFVGGAALRRVRHQRGYPMHRGLRVRATTGRTRLCDKVAAGLQVPVRHAAGRAWPCRRGAAVLRGCRNSAGAQSVRLCAPPTGARPPTGRHAQVPRRPIPNGNGRRHSRRSRVAQGTGCARLTGRNAVSDPRLFVSGGRGRLRPAAGDRPVPNTHRRGGGSSHGSREARLLRPARSSGEPAAGSRTVATGVLLRLSSGTPTGPGTAVLRTGPVVDVSAAAAALERPAGRVGVRANSARRRRSATEPASRWVCC